MSAARRYAWAEKRSEEGTDPEETLLREARKGWETEWGKGGEGETRSKRPGGAAQTRHKR